ncbi:hypothetical protein OQA88_6686 [Cercophora sp. LCS_1]
MDQGAGLRDSPGSTPEPQSPPNGRPRDPAAADSAAKRRKVRKGTRSCWECKRRKIRCTFASESDAICVGCTRRNTKCVSQEFPEEASTPADRSRQMGDRIVRVEALVEQLVKTVGPQSGIPTPSSSASDGGRILSLVLDEPVPEPAVGEGGDNFHDPYKNPAPRQASIPVRVATCDAGRYQSISAALHAALPCPNDLRILWESNARNYISFTHMMTVPFPILGRDGLLESEALFKQLETPHKHPVLLARHMLRLANFMQFLYPGININIQGLAEHPRTVMHRIINTVINLITTKDEFLGTMEGLECVMLEAMYQSNCGNLRRAWLSFRRAMVVAQLLGIHRSHVSQPLKVIDPTQRFYPQYVWYRIVYADRTHCMMLGLPQGTVDTSMANPSVLADASPMNRLERIHCALSAQILDRNENEPSPDDYSKTQAIDMKLQDAAKELPPKWWLTPNLAKIDDMSAMFWETLRLVEQIFHFNLLNYLHLPYMLRYNDMDPEKDRDACEKYLYSQLTCVTASREILQRFLMFRSYNRVAFCCRNVDFHALMAAMTLVLAHLNSHRHPKGENLLGHQRMSDQAMMDEVLESMELISKLNKDPLSEKSAKLLRSLMHIEAEAAAGRRSYSARSEKGGTATGASEENVLRICVPYFGTVRIAPEGVISRELDNPQRPNQPQSPQGAAPVRVGHNLVVPSVPPEIEAEEARESELPLLVREHYPRMTETDGLDPDYTDPNPAHVTPFAPQFTTATTDALQQYEYPALTAGLDDWAFQGVDLVFFDSLMRGNGAIGVDDEADHNWDWNTVD